MNRFIYILLIVACMGCSHAPTEKHQSKRNNVINVREEVKEINTGNALIGAYAYLNTLSEYLILADLRSPEELIHIFEKNSFRHVISTVNKGQGPGEIANIGWIGIDEVRRMFYVLDHGKHQVFSYHIDSLIANPSSYMSQVKMRMEERTFPHEYVYINDTLCIGLIIEAIGVADYKPSVGKWNMSTGEIHIMEYEHPKIVKKYIDFAISLEYGIYVECYNNHDLMTICSLDGGLKYNIYGRMWDTQVSNRMRHYDAVVVCGDKIVALYQGGERFTETKDGDLLSNYPTKFHVFDINGDYLKTLETGYEITSICYDKENKRMLMNLDDDMQFAYLDIGKYL